jgi:hypothetical protein
MAETPISELSPKRNVVGGKKHRFTAAAVFFVLGVISGILAMTLPPGGGMVACRYLGFLFGLLFVLFLAFGFLGRAVD